MGFVRCKGPDGAEFTVQESTARAMGSDVKVLKDKPAVNVNGRPLPPKNPTALDGKPKPAAGTDKPKEG